MRVEAALAFRSKTFTYSNLTVANITGSEPAGATANDILFMFVFVAGNRTLNTPTGWTAVFTPYQTAGDGLTVGLYWIRRGASAPTYTIGWNSNSNSWQEISVTCWSGAVTTGTPYESLASNAVTRGPPAYPNPPAITTTVPNTMVIAFGATWTGWATTATPPTGYTIAEGGVNGQNNDSAVAYKALAAAGAEDPSAFTGISDTTRFFDDVEATLALRPAGAAPAKVRHRVFAD